MSVSGLGPQQSKTIRESCNAFCVESPPWNGSCYRVAHSMVQRNRFFCFYGLFAAFVAFACADCIDVNDLREPDVVFGSAPPCGAPQPPSPLAELALEGDGRRAFFAEHPLPLLKISGGPTIPN